MGLRTCLELHRKSTMLLASIGRMSSSLAKSTDDVGALLSKASKVVHSSPSPNGSNFFSKVINRIKNIFNRVPTNNVSTSKVPHASVEPMAIDVEKTSLPLCKLPERDIYIDIDNARILSKHKPITLKRTILPQDKKIIHVSNFHAPEGSISATTPLSECIVTDKIYQCAAVSIVDRSQNMQTLVHCFPGQSQEEITALLKHVTSKSNPKNLECLIAPGIYDICDNTIVGIKTALDDVAFGCKLRFANFSKETKIFDRALVLQNGQLSCCLGSEIGAANNVIINPKNVISYVLAPYNVKF